jgi:hypothetical protein
MIYYFYAFVPEMRPLWTFFIFKNIFCDYCSLFIVRYWLKKAGESPLFAMVTGPIVGAVAVYLIYIIFDVTRFSLLISGEFHWRYFVEGTLQYISQFRAHSANSVLTTAALVVHAWLLLFAVGMGLAKLINSFRSAAAGAQWFLNDGRRHPFKAVGLIASLVTFLVSSLLQFARA